MAVCSVTAVTGPLLLTRPVEQHDPPSGPMHSPRDERPHGPISPRIKETRMGDLHIAPLFPLARA